MSVFLYCPDCHKRQVYFRLNSFGSRYICRGRACSFEVRIEAPTPEDLEKLARLKTENYR